MSMREVLCTCGHKQKQHYFCPRDPFLCDCGTSNCRGDKKTKRAGVQCDCPNFTPVPAMPGDPHWKGDL